MRPPPRFCPGPVALPDASLGFERALVAADPDGHALRVTEAR